MAAATFLKLAMLLPATSDELTHVYDNHNKIQEAEEQFMVIKQTQSESLYQYIVKFERLRYESRANSWSGHIVISVFRTLYGLGG
jgi:hypothetical protein